MYKLSVVFLALSLVVFGWCASELGLFSLTSAGAAEKTEKGAAPVASVQSLQQSLTERNKALDTRETELARREKALNDKEVLLKQQLDQYEKVVDELKTKIKALETQQDEKIEAFRRVYEGMESKRAARILDDVEVGMATQILNGMKRDKAAEILGRMSTVRAKQITERSLRHASTKPSLGQ